jgi:tripartite ATP-independent transporter DctM subunit
MSLIVLLFASFFGLCLLGVPVAVSLAIASFVTGLFIGIPPIVIAQQMYAMLDSFTLLAVPLFLLVGATMDRGAVTDRLVGFSKSLVGHIRGGLGHVNIVSNMIMAGISGSATADAAALGSVMIPAMIKDGYPKDVAAAVNAAAATMGPIIPPSIMMVVYGAYGGVSIAALFLGGAIPGALVGITLMIGVYRWAVKNNFATKSRRATLSEIWASFKGAILALIVPLIIIIGVIGGIFTATESGMIAAVYALIITFFAYRSLSLKEVAKVFKDALVSMAQPLFCVAAAGAFGYLMAYLNVPDLVVQFAGPIAGNKTMTLIFITVLYIILGTFMDAIPAIVIFLPIVQKLSALAALNPVHVGTLVTVVLCFGLLTPPYGLTLLLSSGIARIQVAKVIRALTPFYLLFLLIIVILIFFPDVILFLPRIFVPSSVG